MELGTYVKGVLEPAELGTKTIEVEYQGSKAWISKKGKEYQLPLFVGALDGQPLEITPFPWKLTPKAGKLTLVNGQKYKLSRKDDQGFWVE